LCAKAHQLWGCSSFTTSHLYIYGSRNVPLGHSSDSESYKRLRGSLKSKKNGHLRWLKQQLPSTIDDDLITTVANITIPYCVLIDTTIPPAAAGICVYTGGSLLEERSGAGVYIEVDRQPQVTMSERLPPCRVFQSEQRAMQIVCEHLCLHEHNNKDKHIHVDSQAALQSLVKAQITSKL
jgi:hypothetical protein